MDESEMSVRPEVWSAVQTALPAAKAAVGASVIWISAAAVSLLVTLGIVMLRQEESPATPAHHQQPLSPESVPADTNNRDLSTPTNSNKTERPIENKISETTYVEEVNDLPALVPVEPLINIIQEYKIQEPVILVESSKQPIENETASDLHSTSNTTQNETISAAFHIKAVDENEMLYFFMAEEDADVMFTWVFSDGASETGPSCLHRFEEEGVHTITLSVQADKNANRVVTKQSLSTFYPINAEIPNVFTPNGDGKNETFAPVFTSDRACPYDLKIMLPSGEVVFECGSCPDGWNGERRDGEASEPGIYLYHILLHQTSGVDIKKSGTIYLSR
ncbi:MAG: gliding motility-associated C-terminal domain-containing protein [Flavobacteriales bacterium]